MRELHTFNDEQQANLLVGVLQSQAMPAEVTPEENAWVVWVLNDDDRDQARTVLADFQQDPAAPKFQAAAKLWKQERTKLQAAENRVRKLQVRIQDRWSGVWWKSYPATMTLIGISIMVVLICTDWQRTGQGRSMIPPTCNSETSAVRNALFMQAPSLSVATRFGDVTLFGPPSLLAILQSGQIWRFVTPIFLHFSVLHILFNMLWLKNLGQSIEFSRGTRRFVFLVLLLAVVSNVGQYWWVMTFYQCPPHVPARFGGMSGVVFGLIGYLWIKGRTQPQQGLGIPNDQFVWAVLWMLLCIGGAFGPIANAAHVTGFIAGILIGGRQSLWIRLLQIVKSDSSSNGDV
jgi:GlpG protein